MSVELLESMGDDLSIVNAARVSYAKQSGLVWHCTQSGEENVPDDRACCDCVKQLSVADKGLIGYLMKNRHGTPFEMVQFKFRAKVPIGVAREWQRHRIGSFNEVSTRYVEMQPEFYVPPSNAIRIQVGKPGHYTFEPASESQINGCVGTMELAYQQAYRSYQDLLANGVAKELARNVLPIGLLTEFIWSVNLRSLLNFLSLRTHETALLEIRLEARDVERQISQVAPTAMAAWNENGRLAP